jgi:hypothetical protein
MAFSSILNNGWRFRFLQRDFYLRDDDDGDGGWWW